MPRGKSQPADLDVTSELQTILKQKLVLDRKQRTYMRIALDALVKSAMQKDIGTVKMLIRHGNIAKLAEKNKRNKVKGVRSVR